jgi:DNA-directed RNA polymerase specialized sigma24 family protein
MGRLENQEEFTTFMAAAEPRLRVALIAAFGPDRGRDAAAEALAYAWENWSRVRSFKNLTGYLYRVGQSSARPKRRRALVSVFTPQAQSEPWFEPGLAGALSSLTDRQRSVVVLVHGFGWTLREVAEISDLKVTSVQNHLERGPGPAPTRPAHHGAAAVTVPDVIGMIASRAREVLRTVGFSVVVDRAFNTTVPSGEIERQSPVGGSKAAEGSQVLLVVSSGPPPSVIPTGVYSDGSRGYPYYFITLESQGGYQFSGAVNFLYQNGQTSVVFTFDGTANGGNVTLHPTTDPGAGSELQTEATLPSDICLDIAVRLCLRHHRSRRADSASPSRHVHQRNSDRRLPLHIAHRRGRDPQRNCRLRDRLLENLPQPHIPGASGRWRRHGPGDGVRWNHRPVVHLHIARQRPDHSRRVLRLPPTRPVERAVHLRSFVRVTGTYIRGRFFSGS